MKLSLVGVFGAAAIGVSAQGRNVTITSYYSSCATATPLYTSTLTGTITQTYCPSCTAQAKSVPSDTLLTTYTTVYTQVCSTGGLTAQTFTVTAPCSAVGSALPKDYVPPSFTVVTVSCNSCPTPGPVVVTTPIAAPTSPATAPSNEVGPLTASASPGAVPSSSAGPLAPPAKVVPGGSPGPLSPPQYAAGNQTAAAKPSVGTGSGAPPPTFTSAAMALGRHVEIIGFVALVLGGFYVY